MSLNHSLSNEPRAFPAAIVPWPVSCGALAALVEYGLTDEDIGRYFSVDASKVTALRRYFGIGEPDGTRSAA